MTSMPGRRWHSMGRQQVMTPSVQENAEKRPCWFVGASYGSTDDQTTRFLQQGIWENGYHDRYLDQVKSIRPGDRIAIKSTYVRKQNLPFDNQGRPVSTMAIKAVGTVTRNLGDGRFLQVDWTPVNPSREWYFYTNRRTVWEVWPGYGEIWWAADNLVSFTFRSDTQDYARFLRHWGWIDGSSSEHDSIDPKNEPEYDRDSESQPTILFEPYFVDNILDDGCFLDRARLEEILEHFQLKKNLILQGPPGTGKTWLARKLAFALIGHKDEGNVQAMQFHPNLSYEDFVRGWRPSGNGQLDLVDGPFLEMIEAARGDLDSDYVMVIEEINRGNPAQVFGEMLTLLEADKRNEAEALALSYRRSNEERVYIPDNLYVIGTMNIADRSLALVDLAFRRRFAFEELEPTFGQPWRDWVSHHCVIDTQFLMNIEARLLELNQQIADDRSLGRQFRVGHSYVTPSSVIPDPQAWFRRVVEKEIGPLLDEYWFDSPDTARQAKSALLDGL